MKVLRYSEYANKYLLVPKEVPDSILDEKWAQKINGQTLARLNKRGGMTIEEIFTNVKKYNKIYHVGNSIPIQHMINHIHNLVIDEHERYFNKH